MRIKIKFSKNTGDVPVHNQAILNSYIHKCLGVNNEYHDTKSNYNISQLYGGKLNPSTNLLTFDNGGYIVVSSMDGEFINKVLIGVINNPILTAGMTFAGVDHISEKFHDGWNYFATLSPFIIKEYKDKNTYSFITLNNDNFQEQVKQYLINKLSKINNKLDLSDFDVIIPNSDKHKVKRILVKNVINSANLCHINIHCNKKVAELLYNIGIGQSTGSGFGTIYKTENHNLYKLG
jgi:CRISPR-associated endoribonuclease Cas6